LQEDIADGPGLIRIAPDDSAHAQVIGEAAAALAEDWAAPARTPYVFYATDFGLEGKNLRGLVKDLVEAVTGIPCILGEYVKGKVVQREILQTVTDATLVLADLSGDGGNVYVEVGAARAADVPLFLLRNGPPGRPVFMLRDQQVWDYSTESELLGRVTQIVYPYRRTLLSRERL
jgi:hypothetical protein